MGPSMDVAYVPQWIKDSLGNHVDLATMENIFLYLACDIFIF